jgi:predicted NBD/HSP70 family sugar kinase
MAETVLACDFGGTWLKVAEVDRRGQILWSDRVATARDYARDMDLVLKLAEARTENVVAVGIASPGPIDFETGQIIKAANLNWVDVYPAGDLQQAWQLPMILENDADAAALAEWRFGQASQARLLVFYGIGTGVGSGIVADGVVFHGAFDPEFGHQLLDPGSDRVCTENHPGCLEALISGGALESRYGSIDRVPRAEWEDFVPHYLGMALANAALFVSPDVIVLGGGVIDNRPDVVPRAVREMEVLLHDFIKSPRVLVSQLGREIGTLGAAAAAWNLVDERSP